MALLFTTVTTNAQLNPDLHKYQIAYNVGMSGKGDDYDVWIMNMDGTGKQNITSHPDVAWTYLATGTRIFFLSDRDTTDRTYLLYQMDSAGADLFQISKFALKDSWMGYRKKGDELIVNPNIEESIFYIINGAGEIQSRIKLELPFASDPCFSPDGKHITFRGALKKNKKEDGFDEAIYIMTDDGYNLKKLTAYPSSDTTANWFDYRAGAPRWHPTEEFISYQSYQNGKYSLYAVDPISGKSWKLTENPGHEGWHDWSPDGQWLAIELFDKDQTQFHIGLMNWATKELKILTTSAFRYQQAPVFVEKR